ncbi:MAG: hypothetical protein R3246_06820 [Acidimicrobiia bacterium]|nr:hypothetical protein [Acidimicrobiia bacterium]
MAGFVAVACTGSASTSTTTSSSSTTTTLPPTTTTTLPDCTPNEPPPPEAVEAVSAVEVSLDLSRLRFGCANEAIVTADTLAAIRAGAALGVERSVPVLVNGPGVADELARLAVREVTWVGLAPAPDFGVATEVLGPGDVTADLPSGGGSSAAWIVDGDPDAVPLLEAIAAVRGETVFDATAVEDLRKLDADTVALLRSTPVVPVGFSEPRMAHLEIILMATELPGGGFTFDGKRLVAFYGNHTTRLLGVLGEQEPAETLERLRPLVDEYSADGLQGIPTFEIIATVASARAGGDNDYSDEASVASLRPWIDFAAENGVYVVLDLQPGRTDFLTQAQRYEELLRLPHVGLALDPEWRLKPDQVHLRQIGTVDAAEINQVSEWLAEIVREERLPQKFFMIHQFRFSMITNRDQIQTPPELFTVIQMDGQGPLPTKYETYSAITAGQEDVGWAWGWKNFYDEDSPMATPEQVLALDPVPVFVSFQ